MQITKKQKNNTYGKKQRNSVIKQEYQQKLMIQINKVCDLLVEIITTMCWNEN